MLKSFKKLTFIILTAFALSCLLGTVFAENELTKDQMVSEAEKDNSHTFDDVLHEEKYLTFSN